jgi:beta-N-acetylhexosaminidase
LHWFYVKQLQSALELFVGIERMLFKKVAMMCKKNLFFLLLMLSGAFACKGHKAKPVLYAGFAPWHLYTGEAAQASPQALAPLVAERAHQFYPHNEFLKQGFRGFGETRTDWPAFFAALQLTALPADALSAEAFRHEHALFDIAWHAAVASSATQADSVERSWIAHLLGRLSYADSLAAISTGEAARLVLWSSGLNSAVAARLADTLAQHWELRDFLPADHSAQSPSQLLFPLRSAYPFWYSGQFLNGAPFGPADFYSSNPWLWYRVEHSLRLLPDSVLAGQLLVSTGGELGRSASQLEGMVKEGIAGGILLLNGEKANLLQLRQKLQHLALQQGLPPLLFSADAEPTLLNRKIRGSVSVPHAAELHTDSAISVTARLIAGELHALGIGHSYAPVADVAANKAIINRRSFGHTVEEATWKSAVFTQVTQQAGIAATAKHFPGHGTVTGDTHKQLVSAPANLPELPAFVRQIEAGVLSIMVGHIAIEGSGDFATGGIPASCSPVAVTQLLRKQMDFRGVIITDGMNMGALAGLSNPSLEAFKAGCDLILQPAKEARLHSDILSLMHSSDDWRTQARESARRVLRLKLCVQPTDWKH